MELTTEQQQVILTGVFGDGCISKQQSINSNCHYSTNCKYKEYIDFKEHLLGDLKCSQKYIEKNGYSQTPINWMTTKSHKDIKHIKNLTIEEALNLLTELGVALWFYDDGSLHKRGYFYNLNTHHFSQEIQETLFIPFFNNLNIFPTIAFDKKKDGRIFSYLRINLHDGAFEINTLLRKYPLNCYKYKLWSDEYYNNYKLLKDQNLTKQEIFKTIRKKARTGLKRITKTKLV